MRGVQQRRSGAAPDPVLVDALAELPGLCQAIIRLRELDQLSNQEIASRLGISLRQLETCMVHITNHLADRMGKAPSDSKAP